MRTRTYALSVALAISAALPAWAQPVDPGSARTRTLEPNAVDTFTIRFIGRTLTAVDSVTVSNRGHQTIPDTVPNAIKTAMSFSGSDVLVTLAPDTGCGTAGCRAGNWYQIAVRASDSTGNKPTFNFLLGVQREVLVP